MTQITLKNLIIQKNSIRGSVAHRPTFNAHKRRHAEHQPVQPDPENGEARLTPGQLPGQLQRSADGTTPIAGDGRQRHDAGDAGHAGGEAVRHAACEGEMTWSNQTCVLFIKTDVAVSGQSGESLRYRTVVMFGVGADTRRSGYQAADRDRHDTAKS